MDNIPELKIKLKKALTSNLRPKLACLAAAILVWLVVYYVYVREPNENWDLNDVRLSLPE